MKKLLNISLSVACVLVGMRATSLFGDEPPVYATSSYWGLGSDRNAIGGYDPVAYFQLNAEDAPVEGKKEHKYEWNGADWYFSSAGNERKFKCLTAFKDEFKEEWKVEFKEGFKEEWRPEFKEDLEAFGCEKTPKAVVYDYVPQYGGYCAWAVSQNAIARSEPENWTVYEGKLYLNYSERIHEEWKEDIPGNIVKADEHWPEVLSTN